mgnify:FL=1|tara:strand:+ start:653 stop:856 length:204 start_codon:yes stop_codon:yes gene_type:complete
MTDKWKYNSVSLRHSTYSKLNDLSETLVPGVKLSKAKAIEKLISDKNKAKCSQRDLKGEHNDQELKI